MELAVEVAGGADILDRLWEIVPIVVELLIRVAGEIISERVEKVEPPRGRDPNFTDVGERSSTGSISRETAKESAEGNGGNGCDRAVSN